MQEMRCWGQVGNLEGLESPGNIPFPSSCAPGSWVDVMGGSSLDTALSSSCLFQGRKCCSLSEPDRPNFHQLSKKGFEATNSCNNSGKCQRKRVKQFLGQVLCVIPKERFPSGELRQLPTPDPSFHKAGIWFSTLNKNSFCLNFS